MEASINYGFLSSAKLIFTCSRSNQHHFSPFFAHGGILANTETKKPHEHAVYTLHFYQVCILNVLIYDVDKFLLCLLKLVVLISTQQAHKYSPAWKSSLHSSCLSFLICYLSKELKLYFLIPLHGGELYPFLYLCY